jgi:hypothetical protein
MAVSRRACNCEENRYTRGSEANSPSVVVSCQSVWRKRQVDKSERENTSFYLIQVPHGRSKTKNHTIQA